MKKICFVLRHVTNFDKIAGIVPYPQCFYQSTALSRGVYASHYVSSCGNDNDDIYLLCHIRSHPE